MVRPWQSTLPTLSFRHTWRGPCTIMMPVLTASGSSSSPPRPRSCRLPSQSSSTGTQGRKSNESLIGSKERQTRHEQFTVLEGALSIFEIWWTRRDSNPRPPRCERGALPAELLAHEQQIDFSKRAGACQHAFYGL